MVKLGTTAFFFAGIASFTANAADPHDHDHDHNGHDHNHDHHHHSHGAHVHGAWELFAALDGAQLSVTVKGPIVDILGFETRPASDQERAAVVALTERLEPAESMVSIDPRANCALTAPVAVALPKGFAGEDEKADDDHAHTHDHHDIHDSDIELTYTFTCQSPNRLNAITITGFGHFPEIETVDAVFLSDDKQVAHRLEDKAQILHID